MKDVLIKQATPEEIIHVADNLRSADRDEVLALGATPRQALKGSVQLSDYAWAGYVDGELAMIFGCGNTLVSEVGSVWALGTDVCTKHPREMLVVGRKVLQTLLDINPKMQNYCDARYTAAHRWLKKLGFHIDPAEPYGPFGVPFCRIYISKEM